MKSAWGAMLLLGVAMTGMPQTVSGADLELLEVERQIIAQTNAQRARHGLPSLSTDPSLMKSARGHAAWSVLPGHDREERARAALRRRAHRLREQPSDTGGPRRAPWRRGPPDLAAGPRESGWNPARRFPGTGSRRCMDLGAGRTGVDPGAASRREIP